MGLSAWDIVLLCIFVLGCAAIGVYHGVKGLKQTPIDYLLGGRSMSSLPLAISLTVGTLSGISIMGQTGEIYCFGTQIWMIDIGMAAGMVFVAQFFIPVFYSLKIVSLYQYIEMRFGSVWLRKISVILTLIGAFVFMGFLIYPPSLFIGVVTGFSVTINSVITGLICSAYSSFGGVKAVVYTDVLQSAFMFLGCLVILIQGSSIVGGLSNAWDIAYEGGRIEFFNFNLDPYQRHSVWLVMVYGFFFSLNIYGVTQSQTQRLFSTSSVKDAQRVMYYAIFGVLLIKSLINLMGVVIFAVFAQCNPLKPNEDNIKVLLYYVQKHLIHIPGLSGIFIASLYAAVLSSVSTQINSMTALIWEDFLKHWKVFRSWSDVKVTRLQKILVFITGLIGIATSLIASKVTEFLKAVYQVTGAIGGPMTGLFLVALFLPWVKAKGATIGFIVSVAVSSWIVLGQFITQPNMKTLPMSYEGCEVKNESLPFNVTYSTTEVAPYPINNATASDTEINMGVGFYGISYCLNYCWGILTSILVSVLVTVSTGSNSVEEVDERLIHPFSWRYFSRSVKESSAKVTTTMPAQNFQTVETVAEADTEEMEKMGTFL